MKNFQEKNISLSKRNRDSTLRIQIIKNEINKNKKYISEKKNKKEEINLKNKILEYSEIKIIINTFSPNSVVKPPTNSLSPSEKSKGVRFNSAKKVGIQINKTIIKDTNKFLM